ncbi:unnamed protein product [Rhizophagus irregularis]|nr:unnamed protein product [Rhizophagus irregularis]
MIDLLDNSIPLTLDIYAVLFRSGYFEGYLESVVRIWVLFQRLRRRNYNKASLRVPNGSIRNQTVKSNSALQIIQKAKNIDAERNNNSFKESFINSRNPIISQDKLNYLGKKVSLFLFSLFDKIYYNTENTKQINNKHKPADDKFCDAENCLLLSNIDSSNGIVLIYGHGFYKECLALYNGKSRLTTPLKDNEIPLVEEEIIDSSGKSNDENIQSILERLKQNIDNQFKILYQQWSDYNNL